MISDQPISYWRLGERPGATIAFDERHRHPGYYMGSPTLGIVHPLHGDPDTAIDLDGLETQPLGQFIDVPDGGDLALDGRAPFSSRRGSSRAASTA